MMHFIKTSAVALGACAAMVGTAQAQPLDWPYASSVSSSCPSGFDNNDRPGACAAGHYCAGCADCTTGYYGNSYDDRAPSAYRPAPLRYDTRYSTPNYRSTTYDRAPFLRTGTSFRLDEYRPFDRYSSGYDGRSGSRYDNCPTPRYYP